MRWLWLTLGCGLGFLFAESVGKIASAVIPFLAAYIAARLVRPLGVKLAGLAGMREIPFCAVYGVLVLLGAGYTLTVLSGRLLTELWELIGYLPEAADNTARLLRDLADSLPFPLSEHSVGQFYGIVSHVLDEAAAWLGKYGAELLGRAVQGIGGGVLSLFMGSAAFVYLTADPEGAVNCLKNLLPQRWKESLAGWCGNAASVTFSYLRAYLILCLVTTAELAVGLGILGAENPLASAVIIAVVDALPVFGCSAVLVPWAVWKFLTGDGGMGAGLLILLGCVYAVRQFLEPRLIGRVTGVHPAVALMAVYIGWKTAGIVGMIAAPVLLAGAGRKNTVYPEKKGEKKAPAVPH